MALRGIKVLEMAGLAPAPFCGMLLSDFGASVVRVDRPQAMLGEDKLGRGKRSIIVDLKTQKGVEIIKRLSEKSDVLLEAHRPGVMEKMGLGPQTLHELNPSLVYARLSGYGQSGPYAERAGHDINYVSLSGVLSMLGNPSTKPSPPLNLLADFGGGGLLCAFGILAALLERRRTGLGQVIDHSMTEGTAYLSSWIWRTRLSKSEEEMVPLWPNEERGKNLLDGGACFYQSYQTSDGKYMAVGALEPKFYSQFMKGLELDPEEHTQYSWDCPDTLSAITKAFASKTQEEWTKIFHNTDACVTPVLPLSEAPENEQHIHRKSFIKDSTGAPIPVPAPRLSRTPASIDHLKEPLKGEHTTEVLAEYGFKPKEITKLLGNGRVQQYNKSQL